MTLAIAIANKGDNNYHTVLFKPFVSNLISKQNGIKFTIKLNSLALKNFEKYTNYNSQMKFECGLFCFPKNNIINYN